MPRLEVRLFAVLRERAGRDTIVIDDVPAGATIADLKVLVAERFPELGDLQSVAGVVGTTYAGPATVLSEGDEVSFLPPVSGGSPADPPRGDETGRDGPALEEGVFELSAEPLDPSALQARVAHPSCGAIVVFTGTTRDTNRGLDVARLDYEAFAAMGEAEMARIFADCLRLHGPASEGAGGAGGQPLGRMLRMLCAHRTGVVGVGDPSVVIAVASPHRDAAFLAARYLIDALKERLPVWKKEVYRDGHHWIGDRS